MNNLFGFVISIIYIGIVILCGKTFEKAGKEASRKFIHIMLSNWWIIAMAFFKNPFIAAILPLCFVVINYVSYKYDIIDVMERDADDENKDSLGTVYYAVTLLILSLITFGPLNNPLIGLCGVLTMGYGDGMAAVIGQSIKSKEFYVFGNKKSIAGSTTMFIITLLIVCGFFWYSGTTYVALKSLVVSAIATILEMVSIKGTDNLSVPLLTSLIVFLMV